MSIMCPTEAPVQPLSRPWAVGRRGGWDWLRGGGGGRHPGVRVSERVRGGRGRLRGRGPGPARAASHRASLSLYFPRCLCPSAPLLSPWDPTLRARRSAQPAGGRCQNGDRQLLWIHPQRGGGGGGCGPV